MNDPSNHVQPDATEQVSDTPIRWEIAIDWTLQGLTDSQIGEKMGIEKSTVWRWKQKDEFQSALQAERKRRKDARRFKLENAVDVAIDALMDVAGNSEDHKARVAASKELLDRVEGTEPRSVNRQETELTEEQVDARLAELAAKRAERERSGV